MIRQLYSVPEKKRIRVFVDTDAACEVDDPFAIAHALMSPKLEVKGILSEHFAQPDSEAASYREIENILALMGLTGQVPLYHGAEKPLAAPNRWQECPAADAIIQEALLEDERPLMVLCQGAVTNLACALLKRPEIGSRLTCIWIGGSAYPEGGWEFNMNNDIHAANVLFASGMKLWQVPKECYTSMQVGYAELLTKVAPCGKLGAYLCENLMAFGASPQGEWSPGESWVLGDSPAVGLALHTPLTGFETREAPQVNDDCTYCLNAGLKPIRVWQQVNVRFILEDFFAKLQLWTQGE